MSLSLAIQFFFAILLLRAAGHKLRHTDQFRAELRAYRLLPGGLLPVAPFLLALAEVACIFSLPATALLLSLYTFAMLVNLLRGNVHIDCGCGGWLSPRKELDYWLVLRNAALVMLALFADQVAPAGSAALLPDGLIGILVLTVLIILYEGAEQAISNGQRQRQWMQRRGGASA